MTDVDISTSRFPPVAAGAMLQPLEDPAAPTWMRAYATGDSRAFRLLFQAYAARLHAFFLRSFRDRAVADELLQITFLRLHQARATYKESSPVSPWLFTIAANVRRDEHRRRLRRREDLAEDVLDELLVEESGITDERTESRDLAERVRAAVDRLPEPQRMVVQLHRFEGFTFPEIATILGLKEVAVRVRASRAYDRLRASLRELAEGGDA